MMFSDQVYQRNADNSTDQSWEYTHLVRHLSDFQADFSKNLRIKNLKISFWSVATNIRGKRPHLGALDGSVNSLL